MRYSSALIGLLASTSGLVAVYYWWKAARMGLLRLAINQLDRPELFQVDKRPDARRIQAV